jgi:LuxR family quorum-sensing system transcriptional regulator CciR
MPRMIQLTPRDLRVLDAAAGHGIGDGFTVPAHVPGELSGSCSFATARGIPMRPDKLALTQLVGAFAFEAARRLTRVHQQPGTTVVHVSARERECLVWVARGKSDWEIARILGISPDTVHQYVKHARVAHDVVSRSQLVAKALFSGTISFLDVLRR